MRLCLNDSDPRIYAFQIGLIGYWGEWHSYGYSEIFTLQMKQKIMYSHFTKIISKTKN